MTAWKLCVTCVLYKQHSGEKPLIMTQRRRVQNHAYDPFYDNTWEAVGETLNPGEGIVEAIYRGLHEECGLLSGTTVQIHGIDEYHLFESGRGERMARLTPLCYLHSNGAPQLWTGPAFLVRVPPDFEPTNTNSHAEVGGYLWWDPKKLLSAITISPSKFIAFDQLALKLAAQCLAAVS